MRLLTTSLIVLIGLSVFYADSSFAQFYQKADYGQVKDTKKNQLGGYDYFDSEGNKTGYSARTYGGDYIYYDANGKKIGTLKKEKKEGAYSFYDSGGVKSGALKKTPRGDYSFKGNFEGGLESFTPPAGEDVGYIDPSSFTKSGFKKESD